MAPAGAILAPRAMNLLRNVVKKTSQIIQKRLTEIAQRSGATAELQPALARNVPRQPLNKAALLRQSKGRWYTTHSFINATVRRYMSSGTSGAVKYNRAAFPKSSVGTAVNQLTIRAPFASTLRPNLTGGALPRTAGGYSLGGGRTGGARYFSHTPAAPAQVVNNVSTAVRAFWLSGQKAQFDGWTARGEKRYRTVTKLQGESGRKMQSVSKFAPGSFIDFHVNPTVTALSPLGATFPFSSAMKVETPTLNTEGFLDVLSVDFARALKDLTAIMNDLKRLSSLGDLSITLEGQSTLRVRFPGCDADTVERLCDEVGVQRGVVHQDPDFDDSVGGQIALLFPFADTGEPTCLSSPGGSLRSQSGHDDYEAVDDEMVDNPWLSPSPEGYESMSDLSETESMYFRPSHDTAPESSEYQGLEGIYRFIEQCDNSRRI